MIFNIGTGNIDLDRVNTWNADLLGEPGKIVGRSRGYADDKRRLILRVERNCVPDKPLRALAWYPDRVQHCTTDLTDTRHRVA
ncbi:hypothetical protein D3C86_1846440 [compost metagenome]